MTKKTEIKDLLAYGHLTGELRWKVSRGGTARAGSVAGCIHPNGYVYVEVMEKTYLAHRLVWLLTHGCWPIAQLDHVNGNRSDNRLANLRECSSAENQQNRGLHRNNSSGFVGVSWDTGASKWRAYIRKDGKRRYLGFHATPEEAHEAYLAAKAQLHTFNPVPRSSSNATHLDSA